MKKLNYEKLNTFIASDVIKPFYDIRLNRLKSAKLSNISKRKNPYLFKAKNIETAGDLAKSILDAFLSSQEETVFGDLMENLAIHVCHKVFNGKKAEQGKYRSVDLIFDRDKKTYIVSIKSGPNWGNSDQINIMKRNLKVANKVNKVTDLSYYKICGQAFWELIFGDNQLYKKIIQPLDKEAKKRDDVFKKLYVNKINEMTKDVVDLFYTKENLDWDKIIDYVSKK